MSRRRAGYVTTAALTGVPLWEINTCMGGLASPANLPTMRYRNP